jgi:hypothetical protein
MDMSGQLHFRAPILPRKKPLYKLDRGWVYIHNRSGHVGTEENAFPTGNRTTVAATHSRKPEYFTLLYIIDFRSEKANSSVACTEYLGTSTLKSDLILLENSWAKYEAHVLASLGRYTHNCAVSTT